MVSHSASSEDPSISEVFQPDVEEGCEEEKDGGMGQNMLFLPAIASSRLSVVSWSHQETRRRLQEQGHTWTEILRDGVKTKIFLDYDHILGAGEGTALREPDNFQATMLEHRGLVIARLEDLLDRLARVARKETASSIRYVLASRHGWCETKQRWKLSFRPFFLGLRIRYDHIINILLHSFQLPHEGEESFWDLSVYKPSEQLLACVNGSKCPADQRLLIMDDPKDDVLNYVAQVVNPRWELLSMMPDTQTYAQMIAARVSEAAVTSRDQQGESSRSVPQSVLQLIVDGLSVRRATERKSWIETVWAIHSISAENGYEAVGEELAHVFSRKCEAKYDRRVVLDTFAQGRVTGRHFSIGSLMLWHSLDNPNRHQHVKNTLEFSGTGEYGFVADPEDPLVVCDIDKGKSRSFDKWAAVRESLIKLSFELFGQISLKTFTACMVAETLIVFSDVSFVGTGKYAMFNGRVEVDGHHIGDTAPGYFIQGLGLFCYKLGDARFSCSNMIDWETNKVLIDMNGVGPGMERTTIRLHHITGVPAAEFCLQGVPRQVQPKQAKELAEIVMRQGRKHFEDAVGGAEVFFNVTINTIINVTNKTEKDFDAIQDLLFDFASQHGFKKCEGWVYKPVAGCPNAFVPIYEYNDFINQTLRGNHTYDHNPRLFEDTMKLLKNQDSDQLPWLVRDLNVISFSNGRLQLDDGSFISYSEGDQEIVGKVARHHIPYTYTGSVETPLLDLIMDAQFGKEVAHILMALIGRSLFKVGQLDQWQVMMFLIGVGGTGKSLILKVIEGMFANGTVGTLANKREETFGMANLVDKEIVIGCDMPAKMSSSLPQELLQSMTAGDRMEIPRKGQTGLHVEWTSPLIFASNHQPDYKNTGNNVGRRMVSFRFDNIIAVQDQDLLHNILTSELPNIICRGLRAYADLRLSVKSMGSFWEVVPPIMRAWRGGLAAATNTLEEFLSKDDSTRKCSIERVEGSLTWLPAFDAAFQKGMDGEKLVMDVGVLQGHGFRVSPDAVYVCRNCKNLAQATPKCCAAYNRDLHRTKRRVVYDMQLTNVMVEVDE